MNSAQAAARDTSSSKKREKGQHWSEDEKMELVHLIGDRRQVIMQRFNFKTTLEAKKRAWREIEAIQNSRHPTKKRSVEEMKKQWSNLIQKAKKRFSARRKKDRQTGE